MLAACRLCGWPLESYLDAKHPLQVANLQTLARFANRCPEVVATGTDGCGVPSFYLPVQAMATAFARLADPAQLDERDRAAANQVFDAMATYPHAVAGSGRMNSQLNQFLAGRGIGKGGAEGVFGIALRNPNIGIALKVSDGSARCHGAILASVLERFLPELDWSSFRREVNPPIRNTLGEAVGAIVAATD
jgi:L-asparaginase II